MGVEAPVTLSPAAGSGLVGRVCQQCSQDGPCAGADFSQDLLKQGRRNLTFRYSEEEMRGEIGRSPRAAGLKGVASWSAVSLLASAEPMGPSQNNVLNL